MGNERAGARVGEGPGRDERPRRPHAPRGGRNEGDGCAPARSGGILAPPTGRASFKGWRRQVDETRDASLLPARSVPESLSPALAGMDRLTRRGTRLPRPRGASFPPRPSTSRRPAGAGRTHDGSPLSAMVRARFASFVFNRTSKPSAKAAALGAPSRLAAAVRAEGESHAHRARLSSFPSSSLRLSVSPRAERRRAGVPVRPVRNAGRRRKGRRRLRGAEPPTRVFTGRVVGGPEPARRRVSFPALDARQDRGVQVRGHVFHEPEAAPAGLALERVVADFEDAPPVGAASSGLRHLRAPLSGRMAPGPREAGPSPRTPPGRSAPAGGPGPTLPPGEAAPRRAGVRCAPVSGPHARPPVVTPYPAPRGPSPPSSFRVRRRRVSTRPCGTRPGPAPARSDPTRPRRSAPPCVRSPPWSRTARSTAPRTARGSSAPAPAGRTAPCAYGLGPGPTRRSGRASIAAPRATRSASPAPPLRRPSH